MKQILLFLALATSGFAMAQETTDTTFVVNGKTIKVNDENGKTTIRVFKSDGETHNRITTSVSRPTGHSFTLAAAWEPPALLTLTAIPQCTHATQNHGNGE